MSLCGSLASCSGHLVYFYIMGCLWLFCIPLVILHHLVVVLCLFVVVLHFKVLYSRYASLRAHFVYLSDHFVSLCSHFISDFNHILLATDSSDCAIFVLLDLTAALDTWIMKSLPLGAMGGHLGHSTQMVQILFGRSNFLCQLW